MKEWAPLEVEYYKRAFAAAGKGNYDIYVRVVVEVAILGHEVVCPAEQRHFQQIIVMRIAAQNQMNHRLHPHRSAVDLRNEAPALSVCHRIAAAQPRG